MTAPLVLTDPTAEDDDDITHLYCCDENRAWCGADITDTVVTTGGADSDDCALCVYASHTLRACACQTGES